MSIRTFAIATVVSLAPFVAAPVTATPDFLGANLTAQYYFPDLSSPFSDLRSFTVTDPGVEATFFPTGDPRTNLDFSATNLFITYNSASMWTTAAFNGFVVSDATNNLDAITGVTINAAGTNFAGFDASRLSFTGDTISVNWNGLSFDTGTTLSLDVTFGAVPEPGTWLMLIAGFGLVGSLARRRTASTTA